MEARETQRQTKVEHVRGGGLGMENLTSTYMGRAVTIKIIKKNELWLPLLCVRIFYKLVYIGNFLLKPE